MDFLCLLLRWGHDKNWGCTHKIQQKKTDKKWICFLSSEIILFISRVCVSRHANLVDDITALSRCFDWHNKPRKNWNPHSFSVVNCHEKYSGRIRFPCLQEKKWNLKKRWCNTISVIRQWPLVRSSSLTHAYQTRHFRPGQQITEDRKLQFLKKVAWV